MEKPYVPFYKPYGMTDEEYEYEVRIAEQRLAEWEAEQEALQQADVSGSLPIFKCKCGYETSDSVGWCVHADCCNGNDR